VVGVTDWSSLVIGVAAVRPGQDRLVINPGQDRLVTDWLSRTSVLVPSVKARVSGFEFEV